MHGSGKALTGRRLKRGGGRPTLLPPPRCRTNYHAGKQSLKLEIVIESRVLGCNPAGGKRS
jgi:hypothetical protein